MVKSANRLSDSSRVLKNYSATANPRNLECADNGDALDFLTFCGICESKAESRCACRRTPSWSVTKEILAEGKRVNNPERLLLCSLALESLIINNGQCVALTPRCPSNEHRR
jgi:hypothetical protein